MTPTMATVPPKLGHFDQHGPDPMDAMLKARQLATFTGIFNATGQPAISLPLETSEEGLPIGIQFVAPMWREDLLIQLAGAAREGPSLDRPSRTRRARSLNGMPDNCGIGCLS